MHTNQYWRLFAMTALSFISMYVFMYAMVDRLTNLYPSLNQLYMACLMTAPMLIIEILLMWSMYKSATANVMILAAAIIALGASFMLVRQQTAVGDTQFLRSMIPHHAGAILMCEKAPVKDAELKDLCRAIVASQQSEIVQMKAKLMRLEK